MWLTSRAFCNDRPLCNDKLLHNDTELQGINSTCNTAYICAIHQQTVSFQHVTNPFHLPRVTASDNITDECNQSSCCWYPFMVYMSLTLMENVTTLWSWHWYHFRLNMPLALLQNITTDVARQWPCSYHLMVYMPLTLLQNVTTLWYWHWYHFRLYMSLTVCTALVQ